MKRFLLIAPLLAGCTGLVPVVPPPVMTDEACRTEATRAREVRNVSREANFENYANMRQTQSDRNVALREAYDNCLRAHGRPLRGGVEPVQRID
ncbi:hypothetical protein [Roseococcus pinisoli]|uniref:Phosphoribosylamine--glycine ligase n=1 Tax=Roseococcus pinisoli TaxID=2835040 RepID=A0ABS5Q960_9PROT|nr:hypothetical protein [Roseococcus pinisoli]MBS7810043.1 hypothetical protein [Roseococcus pinisoli]